MVVCSLVEELDFVTCVHDIACMDYLCGCGECALSVDVCTWLNKINRFRAPYSLKLTYTVENLMS
jgi:hypothetical protein